MKRATAERARVLGAGGSAMSALQCPIIPGCVSQGHTRDEALGRIREAIELCLENQSAEGWELPEHVEVTTIVV